MIGCMILGTLAVVGLAGIVRRHRRYHWGYHGGWSHGWGRPWAGGGCGHHRGYRGPGDDGTGWHGMHEPEGDDQDFYHLGGPGWGGRNPLAFGAGRAFLWRRALRYLETTPTQNRALEEAMRELQESTKPLKGEARRTRADLAALLRRPAVDAEALGELYARHDTALDGVRKVFAGTTMKVHDILDEAQRERLAQLIERGPRWARNA